MDILENLIQQEFLHNKEMAIIMKESLKIGELGAYLRNLDKQAELYDLDSMSKIDEERLNRLEQQQDRLLNALKEQILNIVQECGPDDLSKIGVCAEQINTILSDDIDIVDIRGEQRDLAYKACLISKIIYQNIDSVEQEKNSIASL